MRVRFLPLGYKWFFKINLNHDIATYYLRWNLTAIAFLIGGKYVSHVEGLRHPLNEENQFIGQANTHKHKSYRKVRNPLTGSLLERQISRAQYCLNHDCPDFTKWFIAETGMKPQAFIDKWERKWV